MSPAQTDAIPPLTVIAPGIAANGPMLTANVFEALAPQPLLALTDMFPPADPAVAVIELADDEPTHPAGKVQV